MAKKTDGSAPETQKVRRVSDRRASKKAADALAQAPDKGGVSTRARRAAVAAVYVPTQAEVELLAYEIYLERGGGDGCDVEDWLEAERRLRG